MPVGGGFGLGKGSKGLGKGGFMHHKLQPAGEFGAPAFGTTSSGFGTTSGGFGTGTTSASAFGATTGFGVTAGGFGAPPMEGFGLPSSPQRTFATKDQPLSGLTFAQAGRLSVPKRQLAQLIRSNGGNYASSISRGVRRISFFLHLQLYLFSFFFFKKKNPINYCRSTLWSPH